MAHLKGTEQKIRCANGVDYTLTIGKVKNINLRIRRDGSVAVSAPRFVALRDIDSFVASRKEWIETHQNKVLIKLEHRENTPLPSKAQALELFEQYSDVVFPFFKDILNGEPPIIKVRDMSSRWGVCNTKKKQITFSLRLATMPNEAILYVVVHEYCHFVHPNHSPNFWREVERFLPDWKMRRKILKG